MEAFYRFKGHSSGRQAWCKACTAEANKEWRADPEVKARLAEYMRAYRKRQKEKRK